MSDNPEALGTFRSGQRMKVFGTVFMCAGGFTMGYALGRALSNDFDESHPYRQKKGPTMGENFAVVAAGAGITALGIIIFSSGNKRMLKGVESYNNQKTAYTNFGFTGSGIGMSINF